MALSQLENKLITENLGLKTDHTELFSPVESRDASPASRKPKEGVQSTPDSTAKKERRGRPKGSRNKPKNEALLSSPSTDAIKVRISHFRFRVNIFRYQVLVDTCIMHIA